MKKYILQISLLIFVVCFGAGIARADTTNIQTVLFHVQSVTNSTGCPGSYTGYAFMTNSAGTMWIKPPVGTTSGTFTDLSGNTSATCVTRQMPPTPACGTNSVTFAVISTANYELYVYVKNDGLTNGQPMTVQVVWH